MGLFGEIATEGTIRLVVRTIAEELERNEGKPEVCEALKRVGRETLTFFDYSTPAWAVEYQALFAERPPQPFTIQEQTE